jgi:hypothetical protein
MELTNRNLTNVEVANTHDLKQLIGLYVSPYRTPEQKPETLRQQLHQMTDIPPNMYFEPFMGKIGKEVPIAQKWSERYLRKAKLAQREATRMQQ